MFVPFVAGFLFIWRLVSKTDRGSGSDFQGLSHQTHLTAARHPALPSFLTTSDPSHMDSPIFPDITARDLSSFIRRNLVPGGVPARPVTPPSGVARAVPNPQTLYRLTPYGCRVAADIEARELRLPDHVIDAIFWWRRPGTMSAYYGGINLAHMFYFSELRRRLRFIPIAPGRYFALPPFSFAPPPSEALPGSPDPVLLQEAWAATSPVLTSRRTCRVQTIESDPPEV